MKCIHPEKPCPYRVKVCRDGKCWLNCKWSCRHDEPDSDCEIANESWGCPFLCIYDALDKDSVCPFKDELKQRLEEDLKRRCGDKGER